MIDLNAILTQAMTQAVQSAVDTAIQPLLVRIRILEDRLEEKTFTAAVKQIVQHEFAITDFNDLINFDADSVDFDRVFESTEFEEAVCSVIRNSL